jgi:hypothetical protein
MRWSVNMRKCVKTNVSPLQTSKNFFYDMMILVVYNYTQMHQNTFLITTDVKKGMFLMVWKYA